jgi:hypothetical protein
VIRLKAKGQPIIQHDAKNLTDGNPGCLASARGTQDTFSTTSTLPQYQQFEIAGRIPPKTITLARHLDGQTVDSAPPFVDVATNSNSFIVETIYVSSTSSRFRHIRNNTQHPHLFEFGQPPSPPFRIDLQLPYCTASTTFIHCIDS